MLIVFNHREHREHRDFFWTSSLVATNAHLKRYPDNLSSVYSVLSVVVILIQQNDLIFSIPNLTQSMATCYIGLV